MSSNAKRELERGRHSSLNVFSTLTDPHCPAHCSPAVSPHKPGHDNPSPKQDSKRQRFGKRSEPAPQDNEPPARTTAVSTPFSTWSSEQRVPSTPGGGGASGLTMTQACGPTARQPRQLRVIRPWRRQTDSAGCTLEKVQHLWLFPVDVRYVPYRIVSALRRNALSHLIGQINTLERFAFG
ncbi:hypothetical protein LX32DRAFT_381200 [Colletotrichum zoysiae]|uniref:Uncharacterized protein n=1 Tax=Colletotrichum zoysiae TaxID=1216348 RepID=A0AAD9HH00_9PEZI|nr:hypothetical protein LX32DRAFT_381200 [Colletotrichum zoysiae]